MKVRNVSQIALIACINLLAICGGACASAAEPEPEPQAGVKVVGSPGSFRLLRNGQPYVIKGAGGTGSRKLLIASGANSIRTWGSDNIGQVLDEAQRDGLTVTVGIWLGHADALDYHNADAVKKQFEMCREVVQKYKDHPALLIWAFGNEMEGDGNDPAVWRAINDIAAMSKSIDPNHPTMTVTAELGGDKVKNLNTLCPNIDIMGINSYGGALSLAERYRKLGGVKPYVVTEFGPAGPWEMGKTRWGAPIELTSTEKGESYRKSYQAAVAGAAGQCLGSYAFLWGNKQEATATWFGMLLPDGSRLAAVDVMSEFWTGKAPANRVPRIESLTTPIADHLKPGQVITVDLKAIDPEGGPIKVKWVLTAEGREHFTGGRDEAVPIGFDGSILEFTNRQAKVKLPVSGGGYRVFAYVFDGAGGAAVANVPLSVDGPVVVEKGTKTDLPFVVYDEAGGKLPFAPTGWMGNTAGLKLDLASAEHPHTGKTCAQVVYSSPSGWAGVACQYPSDDWGDKPGGFDLTGAKKLSFWMRGASGGEKVKVEFGILGQDKQYFDTASGKLEVTLTREWTRYEVDLSGKDLSRIKTGFVFTLAGAPAPVTFFIDDVRYE